MYSILPVLPKIKRFRPLLVAESDPVVEVSSFLKDLHDVEFIVICFNITPHQIALKRLTIILNYLILNSIWNQVINAHSS